MVIEAKGYMSGKTHESKIFNRRQKETNDGHGNGAPSAVTLRRVRQKFYERDAVSRKSRSGSPQIIDATVDENERLFLKQRFDCLKLAVPSKRFSFHH